MDTKKKIIDCGIELFKQKGYESTTIPMICETSGVSKGTYYYYFSSKSDIIYDYIAASIDSISDIMPEVLGLTNAYDQLWMIFQHSIKFVEGFGPKLLKAFYQADIENGLMQLSALDGSKNNISFLKYDKLILSIIKRGQKNGEINNRADATELMNAYSAALTGIGLDWSCHDGKYDKVAMEKQIFRIIFSA